MNPLPLALLMSFSAPEPEPPNILFIISDDFSFAVFVDAGSGFTQIATLGGADNSALAHSTQQVDMSSVATADVLNFRIECAHSNPDAGGNTTLQFAEINLNGTVK